VNPTVQLCQSTLAALVVEVGMTSMQKPPQRKRIGN